MYLREAHASDEWPMGNHVQVARAKSLEDRAAVARKFAEETGLTLPVYLDCFSDQFMTLDPGRTHVF